MSTTEVWVVLIGALLGFVGVRLVLDGNRFRPARGEPEGRLDTPQACLAFLGLGVIATPGEIEAAYAERLRQCQAKVAACADQGQRERLAAEAARLDAAYALLKAKGCLLERRAPAGRS